MFICTGCQKIYETPTKFCKDCGEQVEEQTPVLDAIPLWDSANVVCEKCQTHYNRFLKFCPECGEINELSARAVYICTRCFSTSEGAIKICQNCGGTVIRDNPFWLEKMLDQQQEISYPEKKLCDIKLRPGYLTSIALSEYVKKHLEYFYEEVEVEPGMVFTGRNPIKTPATSEEIRHGNPRTKKRPGGSYLSLYFRINLAPNGYPMNYSLYRKTESDEDTESFFTKFLIFFIGIPLGLVLMPLTLFFPDPTEAVALKTMDFSTIPGSFTRKLPLKKREIYTFFGLYLGFLGLHNFYAGKAWKGILQLLLSVLLGILIVPLIISLLWAWIELASGKDAPTMVETI